MFPIPGSSMLNQLIALLSWCSIASAVAIAQIPKAIAPYTAESAYKTETVEGFSALINPQVLEHAEEAAAMKTELASQLRAINSVMPDKPLAKIKTVRIWVEWKAKEHGAAEFHPSATWLTLHGYNPAKAGCVEINNARNFVKWSRGEQPWMVLHEMAHAFHFHVLGERHVGVEAAFGQAVERKLYESVAYVRGGKQKAYAITNSKEYFAELSEAYFGKNDFYPFVNSELKAHDPTGYELMRTAWGEPRSPVNMK